jgi:tryptophan halogenase
MPARIDNRIDHFATGEIKIQLEKIKASLTTAGQQAMSHGEFIRKHCTAPDFD